MEKISIIVPVYNGEAWIADCLKSIQEQTWTEWELFVIDNSSTDKTADIVSEFAQKDERIRLTVLEHHGVSAGRNKGLDQADGKYITFVDADDKIDSRMLETLHGYLEKEKSDIIVCDYFKWHGAMEDKNISDTSIAPVPEKGKDSLTTVDKKTYVADYLLHGYTRCWSILYRRSTIGKVRFREELSIGEDMMFLVDLLKNMNRISITDYKGYYYRLNPSGAMLRPFKPSYMDEIKSWRLAAKLIEREYPEQKARVASILAVSAMLAAGKLSRLSDQEIWTYQNYVDECQETVKESLMVSGAKKELPAGYGLKTALFCVWPKGYLKLYRKWKG